MHKANPTWIGAFVLGAAVLMISAVMIYGGGRWFTDRIRFVSYFEGSVNGLSVGAPVKFRGVKIGEVRRVSAIFDREKESFHIEVAYDLIPSAVKETGSPGRLDTLPEDAQFDHLVEALGLRAQLASQSLVTGQLYVDLDLYPAMPAERMATRHGIPEIPAIPSELQRLRSSVYEALAELRNLPLDELMQKLVSAVEGLDHLFNSDELRNTMSEAMSAISDIRRLVRETESNIDGLSDSAATTLTKANGTLESLAELVQPNSPIGYEITDTLRELSLAARSVRRLAGTLEQNPNAVIFGADSGEAE